MLSVFPHQLNRSVVAAGEKQATADYRISKRYETFTCSVSHRDGTVFTIWLSLGQIFYIFLAPPLWQHVAADLLLTL